MSKFDDALKRLSDALENPLSKIEGTFSMFNLRSVAKESALIQNNMEILESNYSLDTAQGEYLDSRAADFNIFRHSAEYARGSVIFYGSEGVQVPLGTSVTAPDYGVQFLTTADVVIKDGTAIAPAQAETPGPEGNVPAGAIVKIDKELMGVNKVTNLDPFTGGKARESDSALRLRVYFAIRNPRTSGNLNDYISWAMEVPGVTKVRVTPLWNGPGSVKVALVGENGQPAPPDVVGAAQEHIDPPQWIEAPGAAPVPHYGMGGGVAPIGAIVTVTAAEGVTVNVTAKVDLGTKGDLEAATTAFKESLGTFLGELAFDGKTYNLSPALVGFRLLQVPGVLDYSELRLNGQDAPVRITGDQIYTVGTIKLVEAVGM